MRSTTLPCRRLSASPITLLSDLSPSRPNPRGTPTAAVAVCICGESPSDAPEQASQRAASRPDDAWWRRRPVPQIEHAAVSVSWTTGWRSSETRSGSWARCRSLRGPSRGWVCGRARTLVSESEGRRSAPSEPGPGRPRSRGGGGQAVTASLPSTGSGSPMSHCDHEPHKRHGARSRAGPPLR
jgi:hypothetical protein